MTFPSFSRSALILVLLCSCRLSPGWAAQVSTNQSESERIKEVSVFELKAWMDKGSSFKLIDVREDNEWQAGHAARALHLSRWTLADRIATVAPDKGTRIVLYCQGGVRSASAAATLQKMGYSHVFSLAGGFNKYTEAGLPTVK